MKKSCLIGTVCIYVLVMSCDAFAVTLSREAKFSLLDGFDCSFAAAPVDGAVDCVQAPSIGSVVNNPSFLVSESFYEFDLSGLNTAPDVSLTLLQTGGVTSVSNLQLSVSYYVGSGSPDASLFGGGAFLTSFVIDFSDAEINILTFDVTNLFNDFINNGDQFLGFRLHNNSSNQVIIGDATLDGTITAVPLPATAWLFGSGLLGLVGMARRKKT